MKWYWWLIKGYLAIALVVSLVPVIVSIRDDWEKNARWAKDRFWRSFIKDAFGSIKGSVVFGLVWGYYFVIEPLFQKGKEVKGMKQSLALSYWLATFFLLLVILVVALLTLAEKDIITIFFTVYFGLGIVLGVDRNWDKLAAYQMNKQWGLLVLTYFQVMILMGISWPFILSFILIKRQLKSRQD